MAVLLNRIDINAQHRAVVLPVITEVEDILERFSDPEAGRAEREVPFIQALIAFIEPVGVRHDDRAPAGEAELVQMGGVPARERAVDSRRKESESVGTTDEEVAPRRLA